MKYLDRPVPDEEWAQAAYQAWLSRVRDRQPVPWLDKPECLARERELLLFPAPSKNDDDLVSFLPLDTKRRTANVRISIKPGRYLKRFHGDILTEQEIDEFQKVWIKQYAEIQVNFTQTGEESFTVYAKGPHSCWKPSFRDQKFHYAHTFDPSRGADVCVAYLGILKAPKARAIAWLAKKRATHFYGDVNRLQKGLRQLGFSFTESLTGARVLRIPHPDNPKLFICPALGCNSVAIPDAGDPRFLVMSAAYTRVCRETSPWAREA